MKLHFHIAQSILVALNDIFVEGYYADKVIERQFRNHPKWGARDRRFFAETVYGITRWWRYLWYLLDEEPDLERHGYYLLGAWLIVRGELGGITNEGAQTNDELPQWAELEDFPLSQVQNRKKQNVSRAIRQSVPDWIDQLAFEELGERWEPSLQAMNKIAPVVLRANTLKISKSELQKYLQANGTETTEVELSPQALVLKKRENVFKTEEFKKGFFEMQDASSQRVALMLNPQPGERVIDACAGAGGKTLHMAALMKNKGKIIAMDVEERKLQELKLRNRRAGVDIVETKPIESTKTIKRLKETADALLLDVPCSGIGVWRRNPDSRWKLTEDNIKELLETQAQILSGYSEMVKPGGRMVYATCSLLPSENEKQVSRFLEANAQWKKVEELRLWPDLDGYDGFYICSLKRN
ncbi:MAG: RsmB/NOP family class I SAM-dependent RNA methyltransferase [Bdellovibrionales bacterium]